jgi:hypothetical protein
VQRRLDALSGEVGIITVPVMGVGVRVFLLQR